MGTKVIIDKEQGAAFIKRSGQIEVAEMFDGTDELRSDPSFSNINKALSDLSDADFSALSTYEIESYARYCEKNLKDIKIAVVAPKDLLFGISRMIEVLSNVENIIVTRDLNEALAWLGVILPHDF